MNRLEYKNDFDDLFRKIFKLGNGRILIESGLIFLSQLIKFKFINNLYLFKSNDILKNRGYNNTNIRLIKRLKLDNILRVNLKNDKLFKVFIK